MRRTVTNRTEGKTVHIQSQTQLLNLHAAPRRSPGRESLPFPSPFSSLRHLKTFTSTIHICAPVWLFLDGLKYQGILDSSISFCFSLCLSPPLTPIRLHFKSPACVCVWTVHCSAWRHMRCTQFERMRHPFVLFLSGWLAHSR